MYNSVQIVKYSGISGEVQNDGFFRVTLFYFLIIHYFKFPIGVFILHIFNYLFLAASGSNMADVLSWNLSTIKLDVIKCNRECSQRGLLQSAKW